VVSVLVIVAIILAATGWWLWQNQNQANHKIIKPDSAKPAGRQADSSPAQTAGVTQVIRFVAKINSAAKQQFGDCFASSIAAYPRNDAWRCNIGNQIFDPCFSADKVDTVVCGADPMKNDDGFPLLLKNLYRRLIRPRQQLLGRGSWSFLMALFARRLPVRAPWLKTK